MGNFYDGGIPAQGGTNLFPSQSGSEKVINDQLEAEPSEEGVSKGGPASFGGSSNTGFVSDNGYMAGADVRHSESGMKTIDLNDVSHTV